jgi:hypothetical protein
MSFTPDRVGISAFDPLKDNRWDRLLLAHPRSSIFHTSGWLRALQMTYDYQPIALSTCGPNDELDNAITLCHVKSWLTGNRLVSLPFSDHCDPMFRNSSDAQPMMAALQKQLREENSRYIELRTTDTCVQSIPGFTEYCSYCFHYLELTPDIDSLFRALHKDSTQRKIKRAEREGLIYVEGHSSDLLDEFYRLMLLTRRRHNLPPQPKQWFVNVIDCLGPACKLRMAFKDKTAVAAILTLRHKDTAVYKYGCSDASANQMGGTQLVLWRSIEESAREGLRYYDFGRSDLANSGLITFKDRWGCKRVNLPYWRYTNGRKASRLEPSLEDDWKRQLARRVLPYLSDNMLASLGSWMYRHIG